MLQNSINSYNTSVQHEVRELIQMHQQSLAKVGRKERNEMNPFLKRNLRVKTMRTPQSEFYEASTNEQSMILKGYKGEISPRSIRKGY